MKFLYLDTETTGVVLGKDEVIQIAGIIEVDNKIVDAFNIKCRPANPNNLDDRVLGILNKSRQEILNYPNRKEAFEKLIAFLDKHINKTVSSDRAFLVGYNINFDRAFLEKIFFENNNKNMNNYFFWERFDLMSIAFIFKVAGALPEMPNMKLTTLAKTLNLLDEKKMHDAMQDVLASVKLFHYFDKRLDIKKS